jgi:hypothetical protein
VARFQRPAEGTWTEHYPELGTGPVSFEDSISPAFYELEREAIFKRACLNVGRMEQLPRNGSYFTKDLPGLRTGLIAAHRHREIARYLLRFSPIVLRHTRRTFVQEFKRAAVNDLGFGQSMELLGMTQFTPYGGAMNPLDRAWNDPDLWKKG